MKILVTNDDGWDAPGLQLLHELVAPMGDVWVVAPATAMSGISHQITFERPVKLQQRRNQVFSLTGTPADCVRIATTQLGLEFDWVLSGINNGANLGADIFVSGTFAATREATLRGTRSIALSQHRRKFHLPFEWNHTRDMAIRTIEHLLNSTDRHPVGTAINVNFPDRYHVDAAAGDNDPDSVELVECPLDPNPLPADFESPKENEFIYCSQYSQRPRSKGHDIDVCFSGKVSISRLQFGSNYGNGKSAVSPR